MMNKIKMSLDVSNDVIDTFIERICATYKLNCAQVRSVWDETKGQYAGELSTERLLKCSKLELVALCKKQTS